MTFARLTCCALLALTAGLFIGCREKGTEPEPAVTLPAAPGGLTHLSRNHHSVTMWWQDHAIDEDGFYFYQRADTDSLWARLDTLGRDAVQYTATGLLSGAIYHFRLTAFNGNGESEPCGELVDTTVAIGPPLPPFDLAANMATEYSVEVSWHDSVAVDSFLVERRTATEPWRQIAVTPGNVYRVTDTAVLSETRYLYRVGAAGEGGIGWSLDSAVITTPLAGVPLPPDCVLTFPRLGVGVGITWRDRSGNETGFEIGRGLRGGYTAVIDTVPANATSYFDSLGPAMNIYLYRVRAFNDTGTSEWSERASSDYRFCSHGLIPLCIGNFWRYDVDSAGGPDYELHREVLSVSFFDSLDYYLFGQRLAIPAAPFDTLRYLRNTAGSTVVLPYPSDTDYAADTLFRPAQPVPNFWYAEGDCVIVLNTNTTQVLSNGQAYDGLISFQRFYEPDHSIQYYVKPYTLGIVREKEYRFGELTIRDLIAARIINTE